MIPKYIIYSFRDSDGNYLCILDKDRTITGYYYQRNTYYKKRLSKKLVNSLLPDCYQFIWFCGGGPSYKVSIKHEAIFNSNHRREQLQELEGHIFEVYYEIP